MEATTAVATAVRKVVEGPTADTWEGMAMEERRAMAATATAMVVAVSAEVTVAMAMQERDGVVVAGAQLAASRVATEEVWA